MLLRLLPCLIVAFCLWLASPSPLSAADELEDLSTQASAGLARACRYYYDHVALHGGYVYYYSLDLQTRWGEGAATPTQIWVQPPGTPTVGRAYLAAYAATQDAFYLQAATAAAEALMFGQLNSGCWEHAIDWDPRGSRTGDYRNGQGSGKKHSTLDDNSSQAALLFLMECDRAHGFQHARLHEAAQFGLTALLAAQFPNGGFPQIWEGPVAAHPVQAASYPDYNWRTEHREKEYWHHYTLNDQLCGDVLQTLLAAVEIYDDARAGAAIRRLGDFLLLAQMPEPQPAWAQQYNVDMHPAWARKFEPPAITGSESQDAVRTLLAISRHTGETRYLAPVPRALAYLKSCELPSGKLARFYELQSNRPLYMTRDYQLTYSDDDLPTHYGFVIDHKLDQLNEEYAQTVAGTWQPRRPKSAKSLAKEVRSTLSELDDQGRWISVVAGGRITGQPKFGDVREYLSSAVFAQNVARLSDFLAAMRREANR